jgi:3-dehydroquinate synthetase
VGAFWTPQAVLSDPALLASLPPAEWAAGFAECVKTALLAGGPLWELARGLRGAPGTEAQTELVQRCAGFKAVVVSQDPRESGLRAILNLGHTIGHGVETAADGALRHGEAVSIGLVAALRLSVDGAGLDPAVADEVEQLLAANGLPVRAAGVAAATVLDAMRHDKKRADGEHRFVLLEKVGVPRRGVAVAERDVEQAVGRSLRAAAG